MCLSVTKLSAAMRALALVLIVALAASSAPTPAAAQRVPSG